MSFAPVHHESDVILWLYDVYYRTHTETAEDRNQLSLLAQKVSELHSDNPDTKKVFEAVTTSSAIVIHSLAKNALLSLDRPLPESPRLRALSSPDFLHSVSPTPPLPSFLDSRSRS